MSQPPKPALIGLSVYLFAGLTIGVTHLLAHGVLSINRIADRLAGSLPALIEDGTALAVVLYGFLLVMPVVVVIVAAAMGRHGARTYQRSTGAAAVTTLVGVPLAWVMLAVAALIVAGIQRTQGASGAITGTVNDLTASIVQLILVIGPLVGLAAWVAKRSHAWTTDAYPGDEYETGYEETPEERPLGATDPGAWEAPRGQEEAYPEEEAPAADADGLVDHPVDCPRCGRSFTVSGPRPLRISCPDCGKTGTIQ